MGKVVVIKNLELKKPLFPKNGKNTIFTTIRVRKPIVRKDGREDYSNYSPLMKKMRCQDISKNCGLTDGVVKDLQMYIERGLGLQESCTLSGVDWNVFMQWKVMYPEFKRFIDQCQARAEYDALKQVHTAKDGGVWQASSWFLERKWPDKYGRRDVTKYEIFNHYNMFVQIVLEVINETDPELRATILNKLRAREIKYRGSNGMIWGLPALDLRSALGLVTGNLVFVYINHFLVGTVVKLARGQSFAESGVFEFLTLSLYFATLSLGTATALAWAFNPPSALLTLLPLILLYQALRLPALMRQTKEMKG